MSWFDVTFFIIVIIIIIILVVLMILYQTMSNGSKNEGNIGNEMCKYIYFEEKPKYGNIFCAWCPGHWDDVEEYVSYWKNPNKATFQHQFIKDLKIDTGKNKTEYEGIPVIHFRCSDVPFVKNNCYKLPKKEIGDEVLRILKDRGYTEVIWLSNSNHREKSCTKGACEQYGKYYRDLLQGIKIIEISDGTKEEDFMLMHNSPLVIGFIASSFSMMSKIHDLDNYKVVYGSKHVENIDLIPWSIKGVDCLSHEKVKDYCNSEDVIKELSFFC
jgi:hypothetical protein